MLKLEEIEGKEVTVTQTKSQIATTDIQKANLKGLGLGKIGQSVTLKCTRDIYGMLVKVAHLIDVKTR